MQELSRLAEAIQNRLDAPARDLSARLIKTVRCTYLAGDYANSAQFLNLMRVNYASHMRLPQIIMESTRTGKLLAFSRNRKALQEQTPHRRLFEVLDSIFPSESLYAHEICEHDLRFFALRSHLEEVISLDAHTASTFTQHLFEQQYLPLVSWFALRALKEMSVWQSLPLAMVRMCKTHHGLSEQCRIELKGPAVSDGSRLDVSVEISSSAFSALLPFCEQGVCGMQRHSVDSLLSEWSHGKPAVYVDMLLSAGNEDRCELPGVIEAESSALPFVLIELHSTWAGAASHISHAPTSFPLGCSAVPLWKEAGPIQKPFSLGSLVRQGISTQLKHAVQVLSRRCELQRTLRGRH